jgi:hypothetical protein
MSLAIGCSPQSAHKIVMCQVSQKTPCRKSLFFNTLQHIFFDLQAVCIPDKKCPLTLFCQGNTMTYQKKQLPKYCKHKSTNRAFVRIDGKMYYLGKYGSDASRREYDRIIAEFLAHGRQTLQSEVRERLQKNLQSA